jgi:uroporphyrinogen III methyltransferase/synthase
LVPLADRPLAAWRVLVTRPQDQAAPFAAALADAGATPIIYPTIELAPPPSWQPLDDALARLSVYGWVIFTSPSAAAFTLDRAAARGVALAAFAAVRIAAVGDQTASALRGRGVTVDLVPAADQQRQEGLVDGILAALRAPVPPVPRDATARKPILFPQALGGRELLRDQLSTAGYAVEVVAVSQTRARDLGQAPPAFDVATFASPSALRAFVDGRGRQSLAAAKVAVIGPTTAAEAAALGVRVDAMPATPSVAALVQALIELRQARH